MSRREAPSYRRYVTMALAIVTSNGKNIALATVKTTFVIAVANVSRVKNIITGVNVK